VTTQQLMAKSCDKSCNVVTFQAVEQSKGDNVATYGKKLWQKL